MHHDHVVSKGLNFERDLEIVIIEQLKSQANLTEKQQKELLKNREIFWQRKLETLIPSSLNKRQGYLRKDRTIKWATYSLFKFISIAYFCCVIFGPKWTSSAPDGSFLPSGVFLYKGNLFRTCYAIVIATTLVTSSQLNSF